MPQRAWRRVVAALCVTALAFVAAEAAVRIVYACRGRFVEAVPLPYRIGDDYGPTPPWSASMFEYDDRLLWHNRGGFLARYVALFAPFADDDSRIRLVRRFSPMLPASLSAIPRWDVELDRRGFREAEFAERKAPGTFRILCLGDSWTFGANVAQRDTYPRQLERLLAERHPGARFEVLNLGVLGYSSFQGKELLRLRAIDWEPDAVVLGFGMNDGKIGYSDKQLAASHGAMRRVTMLIDDVEVYKLLRYWAQLLRARPTPTADAFRAEAASAAALSDANDSFPPRVTLADYRDNLSEMIALARSHGADAVLLDNEIERGPYGEALEEVGTAANVPLVRSDRLIADARSRVESALATALGLQRAGPAAVADASTKGGEIRVVFRVAAGATTVPRALYVVGDRPALGGLAPNRIALHDDGNDGDEHAGDGVWSYVASLPVGASIHYAYTNSGRQGVWEGLDVPVVRHFVVAGVGERTLYRPIESFGVLPFQSDSWHTDAAGLGEIARAVAAALESQPAFARFVASPSDSSATASSAAHSNVGG
jgi:lysophospholipase L1-like esterase